jgi:hypothetical protein
MGTGPGYTTVESGYGTADNDEPGDDGMGYHFTDAAGNFVAASTSVDQHFDIILMYESAAFLKMMKQSPKPTIKY